MNQGASVKLECEVIVNKPIQDVWDYTNNPDNLSKWLNDFVRYEHLTGDMHAPKIGDTSNHTYDQNGKEFTMHEEIIAYDPPRHVTIFMTSSWFDMEIINNFDEISPEQTKLFAGADFVRMGWIMKIMMLFSSKKKMQADHESQINKLKALIESS